VLLVALGVLFFGGTIAIWQARNAVNNEMDSSIKLAVQLIKIIAVHSKLSETDWIHQLQNLQQIRHLKIQLKTPSGTLINTSGNQPIQLPKEHPPKWFIHLVVRDYPYTEYPINALDNKTIILIIQANPMDEVREVWDEAIAFFGMIVILVLLTFISVQLVFKQVLQDIQKIVKSLGYIEQGEYQYKLPEFSIQEYDDIAKAINHMIDVLDHTEQQNRALTQHSLAIQEEERRYLSQDLHDKLGQSLTAIKVMATTANHDNADIPTITASIIDICDHLMTVVRSMMKQLHPLILTELGLKATLEDLLDHWQGCSPSITFELTVDRYVDCIEHNIVIQIFRVVQESLTNIIRHADATQVSIELRLNSETHLLILQITDNGLGCDLNQARLGFGLQGMAERVKLLDGVFRLKSQPGKGMQIEALIPFKIDSN